MPGADEAVFLIGEEYYYAGQKSESKTLAKEYYRESIELIEDYIWAPVDNDPNEGLEGDEWAEGEDNAGEEYETDMTLEEVISEPAFSDHFESSVWYVLGLNHWQLGEWFEAADAFMTSIEINPRHVYAGSMHWLVSDCYEKLEKSGHISSEEADPVIEWGYQTLFDNYPDSRSVKHAAIRLAEINLARGKPVTALFYVNWFLDHSDFDDPRRMQIIHQLMVGLEVCGQ